MSRTPRIPSYRLHRQSGQAVVTLTDAVTGRRKDYLLGKHGTAASMEEHKRVVLDWEARGRRLPQNEPAADLTVTELIARYWRHVEEYYRHADGTPTGEVKCQAKAIPHWHPHQLRQLRALELKRAFGLDVARAVLGHKSPVIAQGQPAQRAELLSRIRERIRDLCKRRSSLEN